MFRSLRIQLGAIVLCFVLLVAASSAATYLMLQEHAGDTELINVAGRQRTLAQQMTWLVTAQPGSPDLSDAIQRFDQTLRALRDGGVSLEAGGRAIQLSPAPDPELRARLDQAANTWAAYQAHLQAGDAAAAQAGSPALLAQLEAIVDGYEARAQAKMARVQLVQLVFFAVAVALLAWGYFFTRRRFVQPLAALNQVVHRIAAGQFDQPASIRGDDELAQLARAFDAMRAEIAAWRGELESRVTQRTREVTSAFELSQEIIAQLDLTHLMRSVTDRARLLTRADAASLCLLDPGQTALVLSASSGNGNTPLTLRQPIWLFPASRTVGEGQTVVADTACTQCGFLRAHGAGQCIATPLTVGDRTLGELCVVRSAGKPFDPDEARALTLLANSAAIAIVNARLIEAQKRQAEQAGTLAERERLAAELHDHLAQMLGFLNLETDRVKAELSAGESEAAGGALDRMKATIGEAYRQVRAALVDLREPPSSTDDLADKLEGCLADFRKTSGLPADLVVADPSALALPRLSQTQALLIVREALTNTRRHAQARRVSVRVDRVEDCARFTIEDDGRGFDPSSLTGNDHLGLAIMQTRAERSGGRLAVRSVPGMGTQVAAYLPLGAPAPGDGDSGEP